MKTSSKIFGGALVLAGLQLGLATGCGGGYVAGGGYVGDGYYGGGPWIDNTVVVGGGGGWYHDHGDHAYVHPSYHPGPSHAAAPRAAPSGGGGRRP